MDINKLSATAGRLNRFFKAIQAAIIIAWIVVICVTAALTVQNAVNLDALLDYEFNNALELGPIKLTFADGYAPENSNFLVYAWISTALGSAYAAVLYIGLGYVRKILNPIACGRPFYLENALYLKKIAVLSLIWGVVKNLGVVIETTAAMRSFGLDALRDSGMISSVSVDYVFSFDFIVTFFVLMLMSYVFSYGAELQRLDDETL